MLPTMAVSDDYVWINKSYRRGKGIKVGDLVNIKHPMFPEEGAIKRVLGMPGDFVVRDTPDGKRGDMMIQVWLFRKIRDYGIWVITKWSIGA